MKVIKNKPKKSDRDYSKNSVDKSSLKLSVVFSIGGTILVVVSWGLG